MVRHNKGGLGGLHIRSFSHQLRFISDRVAYQGVSIRQPGEKRQVSDLIPEAASGQGSLQINVSHHNIYASNDQFTS